jgi:hypothetical protein
MPQFVILAEIERVNVLTANVKLLNVQDLNLNVPAEIVLEMSRDMIPSGLHQGSQFKIVLTAHKLEE